MKITWRLTLFSTFIVSVVILGMFFMLYENVKLSLMNSHRRHIIAVIRTYSRRGMFAGIRKIFLVVNGKVLSDPFSLTGKIPYKDGIYEYDGEYYIGVSLEVGDKKIFAASYVTTIVKGMQEVSHRLVLFAVAGIALSFFAAFTIANFSLSPLRRILRGIEGISASSLEKRLEVVGSGDELDTLAKEINRMLDRIERSYRAQERFVHDVSHELKNPLSSMKGFIGVLKKWGFDDEKIFHESTNEIEKSIDEMSSVVEELLMLSKEETTEEESVDVKSLVLEVLKDFHLRGSEREIEVEGEAVVRANPDYLKIIIRNLIDNALKYSEGRIWIKIKGCCLEVSDEGEGIPKEELDKIFDKFYRVDRSRDRRKGGHGIGLSLVKELAEKMKMRVEVESDLGKGSTFRVVWGEKS